MNTLIEPLLTIFASGITAAVVAHVLTSRREERLFIRQKLEDLHLALHRYTTSMSTSFLPFLGAMAGEIDYNQANDLLIQGSDQFDKDAFPTVERIIGIYFPDLEPEMKSIIASRDRLNQLKHAFRKDCEHGPTSKGPWFEPFQAEFIRSGEIAEDLKRKIVLHPIKTTKRMPSRWFRVPSTRCLAPDR